MTTPSQDVTWLVIGGALTAIVGVVATICTRAAARGVARVIDSLVEIARLPDAVTDLISELRGLGRVVVALGQRVRALEDMAGHAHVKTTITHDPERYKE